MKKADLRLGERYEVRYRVGKKRNYYSDNRKIVDGVGELVGIDKPHNGAHRVRLDGETKSVQVSTQGIKRIAGARLVEKYADQINKLNSGDAAQRYKELEPLVTILAGIGIDVVVPKQDPKLIIEYEDCAKLRVLVQQVLGASLLSRPKLKAKARKKKNVKVDDLHY